MIKAWLPAFSMLTPPCKSGAIRILRATTTVMPSTVRRCGESGKDTHQRQTSQENRRKLPCSLGRHRRGQQHTCFCVGAGWKSIVRIHSHALLSRREGAIPKCEGRGGALGLLAER